MDNTKLNKVIHSQARNVIKNVVDFFEKQKAAGVWLLPLEKATELAAAATGYSIGFIAKIRQESLQTEENAPLKSPPKKKRRWWK